MVDTHVWAFDQRSSHDGVGRMATGVILDVILGLAFVYILLSLLCSAINEYVANLLSWRAEMLRDGIRILLHDPSEKELARNFYSHPLIQGLTKHDASRKKGPSYVPASLFVTALFDVIAPENGTKTLGDIREAVEKIANPSIKRSLLSLLDEAGESIEVFRVAVSAWFNDAMDRVSGWYKRKTQSSLLVIAILVSLALNTNTITISDKLFRDRSMREAIVASAAQARPQSGTAGVTDEEAKQSLEQIQHTKLELDELPLPLGWKEERPRGVGGWFNTIAGLLMTAIALSLGAPFWFDILNRVANLRSSGRKPQNEEASG
jgi:hypothetical protein